MARPARGLRRLLEASLNGCARTATHRRPRASFRPPVRRRGLVGGRARGPKPIRARAMVGRAGAFPASASPPRRAPPARATPPPRHRPGETLVIVESPPAKAVSVQKYLGEGHVVLASYGHVRDLVEKSGSVVPERGFEMVWEERAAATAVVRDILRAARIRRHRRARHRPRPRRGGHLVAHPGAPEARRHRERSRTFTRLTRLAFRPEGDLHGGDQVRRARRVRGGRATSRPSWWTPTWRGARSTTCSASRSRACCGARCPARRG
jgi:hypothetical protein